MCSSDLRDSLVIEESKLKELEDKRDVILDNDLDLTPLKSKHSKLVGVKAKMENNRDRYIKDIDFFAANGSCPTCRQDIDSSFATTMVEGNKDKISELDKALNMADEQISSVLRDIEKIDEVLRSLNDVKVDITSSRSTCKHITNNIDQIMGQIESIST